MIHFSFLSLILLTVGWREKKKKWHEPWDKSLKTHMRLFKSNAQPATAFGIQRCLLLALLLIAFLFCKVRDTLTRGLFRLINIFVHMMLKRCWKAPVRPINLSGIFWFSVANFASFSIHIAPRRLRRVNFSDCLNYFWFERNILLSACSTMVLFQNVLCNLHVLNCQCTFVLLYIVITFSPHCMAYFICNHQTLSCSSGR